MGAGRPRIFNSEEELQTEVDKYFKYIEGEFTLTESTPKEGEEPTKEKEWVRFPEFPSITGLALFLGFESRQSIYDYESNGEFSYTVKRARLKIEANYEQALNKQYPTGAIFALKNFGWVDRQEIKHEGTAIGFLSLDPLDDQINNSPSEDSGSKET